MSALSRLGPKVVRSTAFVTYHPSARHMASVSTASDPIQKVFVDKIREFKSSNQGLDARHKKLMEEEMARLRRVYSVENENNLANLEYKFSNEHHVSLHDLDETKEMRAQIASGEYQKQISQKKAQEPKSALLESIPDQTVDREFNLPALNKPNQQLVFENQGVPHPTQIGKHEPDFAVSMSKMTPEELERAMKVQFGSDMPTIHDDKSPERDLVNFPRRPQNLDTPPTRFHIIPESWFQFFYPKTGVTGPYAFGAGFGTFLLSKEWLVYEHELLTGITSTIIFTYAIIKFGPRLSKFMKEGVQKELDGWENWRKGNIALLQKVKDHYKTQLGSNQVLEDLYNIRHDDIGLQLEGEYRRRLKVAHDDTKRRLNYLVAVADSQRQIAYKNMVEWVITNSVAALGPKTENEVLENCIVNLKQLATKNKGQLD